VPGGGVLELTDMLERKALDWPSLVSLSLDVTKDIGVGLLASWLYDKLSKRGNPRTIRIDRKEIVFDKGEIARVLTERIESDE
jgi:predicted DNA-binding transcriptional regulator AlpA